jgi:hypothetical protein
VLTIDGKLKSARRDAFSGIDGSSLIRILGGKVKVGSTGEIKNETGDPEKLIVLSDSAELTAGKIEITAEATQTLGYIQLTRATAGSAPIDFTLSGGVYGSLLFGTSSVLDLTDGVNIVAAGGAISLGSGQYTTDTNAKIYLVNTAETAAKLTVGENASGSLTVGGDINITQYGTLGFTNSSSVIVPIVGGSSVLKFAKNATLGSGSGAAVFNATNGQVTTNGKFADPTTYTAGSTNNPAWIEQQ